jgi:hypothetical protein
MRNNKMKKYNFLTAFTTLVLIILTTLLFAGPDQKINKTFEAKEKIKIKLELGSCTLTPSPDGKIHVEVKHSYNENQFEAKFKERSNSLIIEEDLHGKDLNGTSEWYIKIPDGGEVDFNTGTGDLFVKKVNTEVEGNTGTGEIEADGCDGKFELNSGTGSVEFNNSKGKFDLNSGTGKVKIENCTGNFQANSGTGSVLAVNITIDDEGEFNSGTGDVEVVRPSGKDFDLSINSGTNDALLDMDGTDIQGYFEFRASTRRGSIRAPFDFDKEDEYSNGDSSYMVKSFTRGKDTPRFYISTGTGRAEMKK